MTTSSVWQPKLIEGQELDRFLGRTNLVDDAKSNIKSSALSILSKASDPTLPVSVTTGLIIGYVQSGKTLSFESVIALAKDNGFKIFIVIAGTSNPLLEQSTNRIKKDFAIGSATEPRRWTAFKNPNGNDKDNLKSAIDELNSQPVEGVEQQYILITVLKNHTNLKKLAELFADPKLNLPTLIIDDEADQASLNTKVSQNAKTKSSEESSTYKALIKIRDSLSNHTYLQYTATPQAPLLINKIDNLSADFVQVLNAGTGYTGGQVFFDDNSKLTRIIPDKDIAGHFEENTDTAPESYLEALRIYIIGVAAGLHTNGGVGNRSMLIHPSHKTIQHKEFYKWAVDTFNTWKSIWATDNLEKESFTTKLYESYLDLKNTTDSIPSFEDIKTKINAAFTKIVIKEINSSNGKTPEIDWNDKYGHILVGGQAMDRGFTVEGLTVTYMPRGLGVGNVDTLQQRARFFGYRGAYLGYCRVYLDQTTLNVFKGYLKHEEGVRKSLIKNNTEGKSLNDWKRAFWLDPGLKACRNNILDLDSLTKMIGNNWFYPETIIADKILIDFNRALVDSFIDNYKDKFVPVEGHHARTREQRHQVLKDFNLELLLKDLLIDYRMATPCNVAYLTGIILQIQHAIEKAKENKSEEQCDIYHMGPEAPNRTRQVNDSSKSSKFQGESPARQGFKKGEVYPGDRAYRNVNKVTIHIYSVDLVAKKGGAIIAENVKVIAIWIPERLRGAWSSQIDIT